MELLRFATAGSVDDGKSTLIGRLLYDTKTIFEDQLLAIEETVFHPAYDLGMGLQQGFDRMADRDLRPDHPLLSRVGWAEVLGRSGFAAPRGKSAATRTAKTRGRGGRSAEPGSSQARPGSGCPSAPAGRRQRSFLAPSIWATSSAVGHSS